MVLQDQFLVNARIFSIQSFHEAERAQFNKVPVSFCVFCQEQLVTANVFIFFCKCFPVAVFHDIKFTTHYRLDGSRVVLVVFTGFCHKFENAEHVSMISNGNGWHFILHRFFVEVGNSGSAIQQAVLRMNVEM